MSNKKSIDIKYEELDQYDWFDEEVMNQKENTYAPLVGSFLMWFSNLEYCLDIAIANLISDRHHERGYVVIKNLSIREKIDLFKSLIHPMVFHSDKKKKIKTKQLNSMVTKLRNLSKLRNKIAHAKWYSLDKDGYVRCDIKTDKENGLIKFKKYKITPIIMKRNMKTMEKLCEQIDDFIENIWN